MAACLETQQPFVIDNTNPSREDRVKYIEAARAARYSIVGYYFRSKVDDCLERNKRRTEPVPEVSLLSTAKKLQIPSMDEGFDNLKYVQLTDSGFLVEEWNNDL
jgi:predicted kinase